MRFVKIPELLFFNLYFFHLLEYYDAEEEIRKGLTEKWNAIQRNGYFSQYKTDPDEAAREKARRQYLDSAGILKDFRW